MAGSEVFVRQLGRLSFALVFVSEIEGMFSDASWVRQQNTGGVPWQFQLFSDHFGDLVL